MVSRKYLGDYRLENRVDPKSGKLKTVPVYRGAWFAFTADAAAVRRAKQIYPALSVLCAALFLAELLLNAPCGHAVYVTLPFAAMVFPIFFCLAGSRRLLTAGDKVTREHADKIQRRFASSSFMMVLFSAISSAGHLLYFCRAGLRAPDAISFLMALGILLSAVAMFRGKDALQMNPIGT